MQARCVERKKIFGYYPTISRGIFFKLVSVRLKKSLWNTRKRGKLTFEVSILVKKLKIHVSKNAYSRHNTYIFPSYSQKMRLGEFFKLVKIRIKIQVYEVRNSKPLLPGRDAEIKVHIIAETFSGSALTAKRINIE